ncbi:MAG TPA: VOC family protein [Dehalococcoidia bacterium]|nr:VOC family protein [Dehalococcoidia bacterium]
MFEGIDHIVIAVEDLDAAVAQYEAIFGQPVGRTGELPAAGFNQAFFEFGDTEVELVAPTSDEGPIANRVKNGGGVHLLAMRVDDVDVALAGMREKGVRLIGDPGEGNPVTGQVFVHPASSGGVLVQIVGKKD